MAGKAGSEEDSFIVKLGRTEALPAVVVLVALGGAEVVGTEDILNDGGGGGGIDLRSRSAFVSMFCLLSSLDCTS
jgi:hypothetical protein